MPLNIEEFKRRLDTNLGPTPVNRFEVRFDAPPLSVPRDLSFFVEQAELPGRSLATQDTKIYGPVRKIPYASIYVETTLTFICTNRGMQEKRFFDGWQEIINPSDSHDVSYYNDVVCDMRVTVFDDFNNKQYIVNFNEVFPLNLGVINLAQNQNSDYARLPVTFAYRNWNIGEDDSVTSSDLASVGSGPELLD